MQTHEESDRGFLAFLTFMGAILMLAGFWAVVCSQNPPHVGHSRTTQTLVHLSNDSQHWGSEFVFSAAIVKHLVDGIDMTDVEFADLVRKAEGEQKRTPFFLATGFDEKGRALDSWRQPLHFMAFTAVRKGIKNRYLKVWSVGENGKNEAGSGDDIAVEIVCPDIITFDPWMRHESTSAKLAAEEDADRRKDAELRRTALGFAHGL